MTNKETVEKNIGLTFDFIQQIINTPELVAQLPDKCEIDFIEKEFSVTQKSASKQKLIKVKHTFEIVNNK
jgi:hypothetical protein